MPTISVARDALFKRLGKTYTDPEFEDLCFDYGIELDDVIQEKLEDESGTLVDTTVYKIEIPANRYDMLCIEGIARALNIFLGRIKAPEYRVADMTGPRAASLQRITVQPTTALVRPFVVGAVLRNVSFNRAAYNSFIDLQDKLHTNLCRHRTLVAIGTHDLDTITGPFTYDAQVPEDIVFMPLKQTREFNARDLMTHYEQHDLKLKKFVSIIKKSTVYPVIRDAKGVVLSLPPIINGAHSAIRLDTKNVLIECTAVDLNKAKMVLNTVVTMFGEYCEHPFVIEPIEVVDALGSRHLYPDLAPRTMDVSVASINKAVGIALAPQKMGDLLSKMQLVSKVVGHDEHASIHLAIPPTRSDILHAVDVYEDVAIAHGYNNIQKIMPKTVTIGRELPLNQLTELLRGEVAMAGYTEVLTWALISHEENFALLRRQDEGREAVTIGNPQTVEFEVARSSLLPSVLKTLGANTSEALPLRLFEISDVVLLDASRDVGARNERRLVAVHCARSSEFEVIHGLLNRVMEVLGCPLLGGGEAKREARFGGGYEWRADDSIAALFPGRAARIYVKDKAVGYFGIVHPEVLKNFGIDTPVCALEMSIEWGVYDQGYKPISE